MAIFKCIPSYEFIRPGIYVQFNSSGEYVTSDEKIIAALDACAPFIQRLDGPKVADEIVEPAEPTPKKRKK